MTARGRATSRASTLTIDTARIPFARHGSDTGLLLELAGEERAGRRVLTRERLGHFYNGSLFYTLAEEVKGREAGPQRTKRPRGAATRAGMPVAP